MLFRSKAATAESLREYAPELVIVATGATPRAAPFDISKLGSEIQVMHAWDALRHPSRLAQVKRITIIGGGMVGAETADLFAQQGKQCVVVEMLATIANGMARNNRMELVERLTARGVELLTRMRVASAEGNTLTLRHDDGATRQLAVGEALLCATGPAPVRDIVPVLAQSGLPYELAGDCYRPGDFLSCLRDGFLAALAVDHQARAGDA